jgi:ribosomal protein S18 acetylase RimI-like enzyme
VFICVIKGTNMEIIPFRKAHIPEAAALFVQNFRQLRQQLPILPDVMEDADCVAKKLMHLLDASPGVAALEGGKLAGYLGWYWVDQFRGTDRKAAYCPEWGHGTMGGSRSAIYRALYRAAAAQWAAAGCQTHALTLLAHDRDAEKTWFWNGFGLTVVDAIRALAPLDVVLPAGFTIRKAVLDDVDTLVMLEAEHWQHYSQSPVFMANQDNDDAAGLTALLSNPDNGVWIAWQDGEPAAYMRFEGKSFGAADVVHAATTTAITGAYTRPHYRGRRVAVALLDAALRDYAERGFERCSVDFESFNPEAAAFWMKYFEPVCLSLVRVPESLGQA